jgi:hypothetical protein
VDSTPVQLAEYAEAGAACRAHEANVRTILGAYVAVAMALVTLGWTVTLTRVGGIILFVLGFAIGLITVTVILRHRDYYRSYMARAQEIEKALGFALHTRAWGEVKASGSSNKYALAAIAAFFCLYFLGGALYFALRSQ